MDWNMFYTNGDAPSLKQIAEHIDNPLWAEFDSRIRSAYRIEPYMDYSRCSMQPVFRNAKPVTDRNGAERLLAAPLAFMDRTFRHCGHWFLSRNSLH